MSFKENRRPPINRAAKTKRKSMPEWDNSMNDLTAYRATPEEIKKRQEAHRSKNLETVRQSMIEKRIAKARQEACGAPTNRTGNAFLREILFNESDARSLLEDTNRAIQVAQDIFGEEVRKYRSEPLVTTVDSDDENNAVYDRPAPIDGLIKRERDETTPLDELSQSVTRRTALNETYSASEEDNDSDTPPEHAHLPASRVDLQRFQALVESEVSSIAATASTSQASHPITVQTTTSQPITILPSAPNQPIKSQVLNPGTGQAANRNSSKKQRETVIPEMNEMLSKLQDEISAFELQTSELTEPKVQRSQPVSQAPPSSGGVTSYTNTLVECLLRMMRLFPQLQERLSHESSERRKLEHGLIDATNRADLLATELFQTQEQFNSLLDEFREIKLNQQSEIKSLQENIERMSRGKALHAIQTDAPSTLMSQRVSVKSPPSYSQGVSPGAQFTVRSLQTSPAVHVITPNRDNQTSALRQTDPADDPAADITADDDMSIERRIQQLKDDHELTLERFKKLGEEVEKSKPPSWQ